MLSRVADAVYWMNRYMERAENVARFIDVNLYLMLDRTDGLEEQWAPLVTTTGDDAWFTEHYGEPTRRNVMQFLTFDADYGSSIVSCMRAARENARSVREIISSEMWEQINRAYLYVRDASRRPDVLDTPHQLYADIKLAVQTFIGVTHLSMTHNEAWHFGRLGRLLERADKTSRIVDVKYFLLLPNPRDIGSPFDDIQWNALLKSASAMEMYRKQYGRIRPERVLEFLVLDDAFPRAMRRCVRAAQTSLAAITGHPVGSTDTLAEARLVALCRRVEEATLEGIIDHGVHEWLDGFQHQLNGVGQAIYETFFATRPAGTSEADGSDEQ